MLFVSRGCHDIIILVTLFATLTSEMLSLITIGLIFLLADFSGGNIKFGSVDVPGCTAAPCILKRGTNKTVTVTFTPSEPG